MIDRALPTLQAAVDALHARLSSGRERATGAAIGTGLTGPLVGPLSTDAFTTLGDVLSGRFGEQMRAIWGREDIAAQGISEQDWAFECEAAWHAIRRGLDDDQAARIIEELVRSGLYRTKHDERRGNTTWLGQDAANAVATVRKRIAAKSGPILDLDEDQPPADAPADETPEHTIRRLTRELAQERARSAVQQTIIRTQQAEIERLNRHNYAEWRLRRSKLKSTQVDTFLALTRIGTKRATWLDKDAPIITGQNIGDELRIHESTARANAEAVCSLPGAPIQRVTEYRTDGKRGQLTAYKLDARDPVELIERMVIVAEALEQPKSTRPRPIRCAKHPRAKVNVFTQHECSRCGAILATDFPNAEPLCEEVTRIETPPPTVDVVLTPVQHARIADEFTLARADRIAREAVAINLRPPDAWKQPGEPISDSHEWESLGPLVVKPPWRCGCSSYERSTGVEGQERCDGCAELVGPPAPVPTGVSNGRIVMTKGADGVSEGYIGPAPGIVNLNPIFMDRRCCKTDGLVRPLEGGGWRCDGCGGDGVREVAG